MEQRGPSGKQKRKQHRHELLNTPREEQIAIELAKQYGLYNRSGQPNIAAGTNLMKKLGAFFYENIVNRGALDKILKDGTPPEKP